MGSGLVISVIVSFLLGAVWLNYLLKIESFEPEGRKITLLNFVAGCFTPLLLEPLVGLTPFIKDISQNNLFYYAMFRVAAIEELVKILPFIFFLAFTNRVNESIDFIKYPAVAAVGFATIENVLYAMHYGADVLNIRGLLCISGHLIYSSMIGYSVWFSISFGFPIRVFIILGGFVSAVVFHGLYDYFLFSAASYFSFLSILSVVIMGVAAHLFKNMLYDVIPHSAFYRSSKLGAVVNSSGGLFLNLIGVYFFIGFYKVIFVNFGEGIDFLISNFTLMMLGTFILFSLLSLKSEKIFQKRKALGN